MTDPDTFHSGDTKKTRQKRKTDEIEREDGAQRRGSGGETARKRTEKSKCMKRRGRGKKQGSFSSE